MSRKRRAQKHLGGFDLSTSFLDLCSCALGGLILLMILLVPVPSPKQALESVPLQRELRLDFSLPTLGRSGLRVDYNPFLAGRVWLTASLQTATGSQSPLSRLELEGASLSRKVPLEGGGLLQLESLRNPGLQQWAVELLWVQPPVAEAEAQLEMEVLVEVEGVLQEQPRAVQELWQALSELQCLQAWGSQTQGLLRENFPWAEWTVEPEGHKQSIGVPFAPLLPFGGRWLSVPLGKEPLESACRSELQAKVEQALKISKHNLEEACHWTPTRVELPGRAFQILEGFCCLSHLKRKEPVRPVRFHYELKFLGRMESLESGVDGLPSVQTSLKVFP